MSMRFGVFAGTILFRDTAADSRSLIDDETRNPTWFSEWSKTLDAYRVPCVPDSAYCGKDRI